MDDVLASIRRIVRTDATPSDDPAAAPTGTPEPAAAPVDPAPVAMDEPLSLTPDMRVDTPPAETWSEMADDTAEAASDSIEQAADELAAGFAPEAPAEIADPDTLVIDEQALEQMVRDVVRDELMNGEIARNISINVQRMIEAEVKRLTGQ